MRYINAPCFSLDFQKVSSLGLSCLERRVQWKKELRKKTSGTRLLKRYRENVEKTSRTDNRERQVTLITLSLICRHCSPFNEQGRGLTSFPRTFPGGIRPLFEGEIWLAEIPGMRESFALCYTKRCERVSVTFILFGKDDLGLVVFWKR